MKLLKLDAINSTNAFLKLLAKEVGTSNWTVVTAEFQTRGRGHVDTKWESERGKNLICSMLIMFLDLKIKNHFYLNCAISIGIFNALTRLNLPQLKVKWPNDIMAGNKKLAGILIENSLINDAIYQSVVGIGVNINQKDFPLSLPKAVSISQLLKKEFDRDAILVDIVSSIKAQIKLLKKNKFEILHQNYEHLLYKNGKIQMFEDNNKNKFLGVILGVSEQGLLKIEIENKSVQEYNLKEIKFL